MLRKAGRSWTLAKINKGPDRGKNPEYSLLASDLWFRGSRGLIANNIRGGTPRTGRYGFYPVQISNPSGLGDANHAFQDGSVQRDTNISYYGSVRNGVNHNVSQGGVSSKFQYAVPVDYKE